MIPARWTTPGAVLDDDQGVDAPQEHGVDVNEIGRKDAASLGSQELLPGRAGLTWRRAYPGIMQDCHTVEAAI